MASKRKRQKKMTDTDSDSDSDSDSGSESRGRSVVTECGQSGGTAIGSIVAAVMGSSKTCTVDPAQPKTTIVRIGQTGGVNRGSKVAAAIGGETTLAEGTTYIEAAQTGGESHDGTVAAGIDHKLVTLSATSAKRGDASKGLERNVDQLTFGNGKTVALLLSGSGKDSEIFRNDVELMKTLLTSEKIGLSEHKLRSVCRKPDTKLTTMKQIKRAIEDFQAELEGSTDGNLIFYYSGHFTKEHQFIVDERDDLSPDHLEDKDLADELKTIPAKHMLLILDMCYSGRADVGAKHADGFPGKVKVEDKESSYIVPRLWELIMSGKGIQAKGAIGGKGDNPVKVVQWSSSSPDEPSYDLKSSVFTKAIIDVVNNNEVKKELEPGQTHATIRQLHRHVVKHVEAALQRYNMVQQPIIKPDNADEEYFKTFPCFAKVM
ncbi:uncharacterized protein LOC124110390 isoform X2 [Haliotis rufescens]|uniref:uncharacterized protein LOC124110390 isoform X2 n=1 Tax=Haliotis rufescens TaxID=6454 RepID=UPI00201F1499|nr:uncharacterized protein LOC124110390 isoform X2 [Haliotis rufescens]